MAFIKSLNASVISILIIALIDKCDMIGTGLVIVVIDNLGILSKQKPFKGMPENNFRCCTESRLKKAYNQTAT